MRYFVLKTGNIVSDEDIRNSYEIVFGELKILDEIELKELMKLFSGIITELYNPSVEDMLRFGKENLAIKIYAQENNCNISVARKEVKNLDIIPMSKEELQNFISSYQELDIIDEEFEDVEAFTPEEIDLSTEREKINVTLNIEKVQNHISPIEIENSETNENIEENMESLVENDKELNVSNDDIDIEQITYNLNQADITDNYRTDLRFNDEQDTDNEDTEMIDDIELSYSDESVNNEDENLNTELQSSEELLKPIFKDTEIEKIKKSKKKKGFFKKLGSLLLFGSSDDDGYDDYDDGELIVDDDYYED